MSLFQPVPELLQESTQDTVTLQFGTESLQVPIYGRTITTLFTAYAQELGLQAESIAFARFRTSEGLLASDVVPTPGTVVVGSLNHDAKG